MQKLLAIARQLSYGDHGGINNLSIVGLCHPLHEENQLEWCKWREAYHGGRHFINKYMVKHSARETDAEFEARKKISYNPAFAKAAINEIKNAIFQRLVDVTRDGGPQTYLDAATGQIGGVDLRGSSMNTFLGRELIPELLVIAKVGVWVDNATEEQLGPTLSSRGGQHPYIYRYKAEDIRSWSKGDFGDPDEFTKILLRDRVEQKDSVLGLVISERIRFRKAEVIINEDGSRHVEVKFFNDVGEQIDRDFNGTTEVTILNIPQIPFVEFSLIDSLMTDAADYQVAHLNLASADLGYALKANYPFYTEQYDPRGKSPYIQKSDSDNTGTDAEKIAKGKDIKTGATKGRAYPINTDRPEFIHPSPEPLEVSMKKQESMKEEVRELINLTVANLKPRMASAESKQHDERTLENGLSYIGLEIEQGERRIAWFWAMYENNREVTTVKYPEKYSLKSDKERREEAQELAKIGDTTPSLTMKKEIAKEIADITIGHKVSHARLKEIKDEIEQTDIIVFDTELVSQDVQDGILSAEGAGQMRSYPKDEHTKAQKEHSERLARIQIAQGGEDGGARGVDDTDDDPSRTANDEKKDSQNKDSEGDLTNRTRGAA